jgi:hypothetical protein
MHQLSESMSLIFSRKDSRLVIVLSTALFIVLLLAVQNGKEAFSLLQFTALSPAHRVSLFITTLFDMRSTFTTSTLLLAVLGSFLGGINLSLAYTYIRLRGEAILHSGLYSGAGLLLAFLGIGCAACGTAFLSVLLGFFGFSAMLDVLPFEGVEVGYVGLMILLIATYALAKKVAAPLVC